MKITGLAVIVEVDGKDMHQVALKQEECEALLSDLKILYFPDGVLKLAPNKLSLKLENSNLIK